jgi:hypothetical protein
MSLPVFFSLDDLRALFLAALLTGALLVFPAVFLAAFFALRAIHVSSFRSSVTGSV